MDESFSTWEVSFERLRKISRIAVVGHIAAYTIEASVSEDSFRFLRLPTGDPLVSPFLASQSLLCNQFFCLQIWAIYLNKHPPERSLFLAG